MAMPWISRWPLGRFKGPFFIGNPDLSRANAWFLVEIFPSTNLLIITDRSPDVS